MRTRGEGEAGNATGYPMTEYYAAVDATEGQGQSGVRISEPRRTLADAKADLERLKPLFPRSYVVGITTFC